MDSKNNGGDLEVNEEEDDSKVDQRVWHSDEVETLTKENNSSYKTGLGCTGERNKTYF